MTTKEKLKKYQYLFLSMYITTEILWVIFSRKFSFISKGYSNDLMISYGLIVTLVGFIFSNKKIKIFNHCGKVAFIMTLFFCEHTIYLSNQCKLKSMYVTVFQQPRLIVLFLVSLFYFKDTFCKLELLGLVFIILSLIGVGSSKKEEKYLDASTKDQFDASLYLILAAFLGGCACSSFEILIKPLNWNIFNYMMLSHAFYVFYGVIRKIFKGSLLNLDGYKIFVDYKFIWLVFLQAMHAFSTVLLSYSAKMVPRFVFMTITKITSDLIAIYVLKKDLHITGYLYYTLCILGLILYKFKHIKRYFGWNNL